MVKISKGNSKMGKVWNISLSPVRACQAKVPCAKGCYALKAYKQYPATKAAWDWNLALANDDQELFFASVREQLGATRTLPKLFRWHVAGDILSPSYFVHMDRLAMVFPDVKFLAFTKNYSAINAVLPGRSISSNLQIVFSAWPGLEIDNPHCLPVAYMQDGAETRLSGSEIECPGNCESCGICWQLGKIQRDVVFHKH